MLTGSISGKLQLRKCKDSVKCRDWKNGQLQERLSVWGMFVASTAWHNHSAVSKEPCLIAARRGDGSEVVSSVVPANMLHRVLMDELQPLPVCAALPAAEGLLSGFLQLWLLERLCGSCLYLICAQP